MGLNEVWRVSQLSYTETNAGVKRQRGNLCRKSDKRRTSRVGMRGQREQRWQGMYEKQLAFNSFFCVYVSKEIKHSYIYLYLCLSTTHIA